MEVPIVIVVVLLVIAGAIYASVSSGKRRKALMSIAESNGLEYSEDDPFNLPGRLAEIPRFSEGDDQEASNVISGAWAGRDVLLFDYEYTTGSGKSRHTTEFSACLSPANVAIPNLLIRPEHFYDRIAEFFGADDIKFDSDEFSRRFVVKSPDKKFAYDVCNPQMMSWLLANAGDFTIEIVDSGLCLTDGSTWSPDDFKSALYFTKRFWELVPEFVWKQYAEQGRA